MSNEDKIYLKEHIKFERKVMDMLLAGNNELLDKLREQYKTIKVESRDFDGYGFFTKYSNQNEKYRLEDYNFVIADVVVDYNNTNIAYGIILFINNGYINMLEGHPFSYDNWIENYNNITGIYYLNLDKNGNIIETQKRNLNKLINDIKGTINNRLSKK